MMLLAADGQTVALLFAAALVGLIVVGLIVGLAVGMLTAKHRPATSEEEPKEEPATEPVPVEEPAVEPAEEPAVEPAEEPAVEPAEEPVPAEEPAEEPSASVAEEVAVSADPAGELVAVKDMSAALRAALGVEGAEHDGEWYSVKYSYGFLARVALSKPEVREYYDGLAKEIDSYAGLKRAESWRQQRIYSGRETLGFILFKGKTLTLALALDPADYAGTKYRGKDGSKMRRFAETPMLFAVNSPRKAKYAAYLIGELANKKGLEKGKGKPRETSVEEKSRDELLAEKQIKAIGRRVEPQA